LKEALTLHDRIRYAYSSQKGRLKPYTRYNLN
jgi:hypothetical protein